MLQYKHCIDRFKSRSFSFSQTKHLTYHDTGDYCEFGPQYGEDTPMRNYPSQEKKCAVEEANLHKDKGFFKTIYFNISDGVGCTTIYFDLRWSHLNTVTAFPHDHSGGAYNYIDTQIFLGLSETGKYIILDSLLELFGVRAAIFPAYPGESTMETFYSSQYLSNETLDNVN